MNCSQQSSITGVNRIGWRKKPIHCTAALFLLLALTLVGLLAAPARTAAKSISEYRGTLNRLQEEIIQQENKRAQTQATQRFILAELEELNKKLVSQQEKLDDLEKKMKEQQATIDEQARSLKMIRAAKKAVEDHLQKRITAYYTMGNIGLMNVTFSAKTLPELLSFHDSFEELIKYDQHLIEIYRQNIDDLTRANAALDLEKSVLKDFIEQTVQEKEALQKTTLAQETLLTQVQTKEKLHDQAILEMQQASDDLAKSIVSMKTRKQATEQKFLADKGKLPPPVEGKLITSFHQENTNKLGISSISNGIAIKAPDGSKIIAVSDGEVTYAQYLRGYGNTVIIHHGYQYYTVTSRIEKIMVTKGQRVRQGQQIGVTGDTATLFDEGLYFEIRHEQEFLDPLPWLAPNSLTK